MIKSPEEILSKIYDAYDMEDLQIQVTLNPDVKLILKAMQSYHSQFRPTDEEIEKMFPKTYFSGATELDDGLCGTKRKAAKQFRDKIFKEK